MQEVSSIPTREQEDQIGFSGTLMMLVTFEMNDAMIKGVKVIKRMKVIQTMYCLRKIQYVAQHTHDMEQPRQLFI
jgi:hypothetical protein